MKRINFASIIVTYRCNARCHMCNTWRYPSEQGSEVGIGVYTKLPQMRTVNVTGGEPFLRSDLEEIVVVLKQKSSRLVISSNGYFTDRIVNLFRKHRNIGIRISLEGLPAANDELRGIRNGFDHGLRTLLELDRMGIKDLGFGITVSDRNAKDLLELYQLSKMMGVEFATAAVHNSFYFHKYDNKIEYPDIATGEFSKLIKELLKSNRIKDWFRAYFNHGLINYIQGRPRLLPCTMGSDSFFLDPFGDMYPCNVMNEKMGNLRDSDFSDIWGSQQSIMIREKVGKCRNNCWMIGSVSQQIKKHFFSAGLWILKNKYFIS